jgi:P27 family predicted phage terminase small subunit
MNKTPKHLAQEERDLFTQIATDYGVDDSAGCALLVQAMEAHERARRAREQIAKEGLTVMGQRGHIVAHPCVAIQRDAERSFLSAMRDLGLDIVPAGAIGRPAAGSVKPPVRRVK